MLAPALLAALLAASVSAAPQIRAAADAGSCDVLFESCVAGIQQAHVFFDNPFGYSDQCTLAAICHGTTVDDFLYDVYERVPHGTRHVPQSKTSKRMPKKEYNRIANSRAGKRDLEGRATASQQNFIDFYYATLTRIGGPYPDNTYVKGLWGDIAAWTGFCQGSKSIPYGNFADWFQYSATSGYFPTCGGSSTSPRRSSTVRQPTPGTTRRVSTTATSGVSGTTTIQATTTAAQTTIAAGTASPTTTSPTVVTTTLVNGQTVVTTVPGPATTLTSTETGAVVTTTLVNGQTVVTTVPGPATTLTSTETGAAVTTTLVNGQTVVTTVPGPATTISSTLTSTSTTLASTATAAPAAAPSNFAVVGPDGQPIGYLSLSGTITNNPEDALTPDYGQSTRKRQFGPAPYGEGAQKRQFGDALPYANLKSNSGSYLCGQGTNLFGASSFVKTGACDAPTPLGASSAKTGTQTQIFQPMSNGSLALVWVNTDGSIVYPQMIMGTYNGVDQTLLLSLNPTAAVFDGNKSGTALVAQGQPASAPASSFSSFSTPASTSSSTPLRTLSSTPLSTSTSSSASPSASASSCQGVNNGNYTASDGAQYNVLCGQDLLGSDMSQPKATTFAQCINACETYNQANNGGCVGVSWVPSRISTTPCYLKSRIPGTSTQPFEVDSAILTKAAPKTCQGLTQGNFAASDNAQYNVVCGQDLPGSDLVQPSASTFQQCVNACESYNSKNGGGCAAVSWVPSRIGTSAPPCNLKSNVPAQVQQSYEVDSAILTQSATCQGIPQGSYNAADGAQYSVRCSQDLLGSDFATPQASTFQQCVNACETYNTQNGGGCVAVSWVPSRLSTTPCYLKNTVPAQVQQSFEVDSAVLTKAATCQGLTQGSYTASDGALYNVKCGQDLLGSDIATPKASTFQQCVNACETYNAQNGGGCVAVSWVPSRLSTTPCYLKNTVPAAAQQSFEVDSAVLTKAATCQGLTQGSYNAPDGALYNVKCGQDLLGSDIATPRASTFQQCVNACETYNSQNGGGCVAVSWVPSRLGSTPCYLKNSVPGQVQQSFEVDSAVLTKAGTCQGIPQGAYNASDGAQYSVRCGQDLLGQDIQTPNVQTFQQCIAACETYNGQNGGGCVAVSWVPSRMGSTPCYLKSSVPTQVQQSFEVDSAILTKVGGCQGLTNGMFNAPDGAQYNVKCGQDLPGSDLAQPSASTFQQCVNACETYNQQNGGGCAAVSWVPSRVGTSAPPCNLKSSVPGQVQQSFEVDSAILQKAATCQGLTQGSYNAPDGAQYSVKCGQDLPGSDIQTPNVQNFQQCVAACETYNSQNGGGCVAVSWVPSRLGSTPCYLKSSVPGQVQQSFEVDSAVLTKSASCQGLSQGAYTASDGAQYNVRCGRDLPGSDIQTPNVQNFQQCVAACETYNSQNGGGCVAVSWVPSRLGSTPCYLKSSVPSQVQQTFEVDSAVLTQAATCQGLSQGPYTAPDKTRFKVLCGQDLLGRDFSTPPVQTFEQCVGACASYNNRAGSRICVAVSWVPSRLGSTPCYLKNSVPPMTQQSFEVDSAIVTGDGSLSPSSSLSSSFSSSFSSSTTASSIASFSTALPPSASSSAMSSSRFPTSFMSGPTSFSTTLPPSSTASSITSSAMSTRSTPSSSSVTTVASSGLSSLTTLSLSATPSPSTFSLSATTSPSSSATPSSSTFSLSATPSPSTFSLSATPSPSTFSLSATPSPSISATPSSSSLEIPSSSDSSSSTTTTTTSTTSLSPSATSTTCPSGQSPHFTNYAATDGDTYAVGCGYDLPGSDFMTTAAASFEACVEACSTYNLNAGYAACAAVSWTPSLGAQACSLKNMVPRQATTPSYVVDAAYLTNSSRYPASAPGA